MERVLARQVEIVAVLHQELAAAHHAEARADLVPELPLDVRGGGGGGGRASAEAAGRPPPTVGPENVGDQLLVRGPVEHVPGRAGRRMRKHLFRRSRHTARSRATDSADCSVGISIGNMPRAAAAPRSRSARFRGQHAVAQRQPGIDAGRGLPDHARAQHQPVADDLRLRRASPSARAGNSGSDASNGLRWFRSRPGYGRPRGPARAHAASGAAGPSRRAPRAAQAGSRTSGRNIGSASWASMIVL